MKNIEEIKEDIIEVRLELSNYKELSSNKPVNWRLGRDMYDSELVEERDALFKVMRIVDEKIKSNKIIINQLETSDVADNEKLILLETDNQNLVKFIMDFFK